MHVITWISVVVLYYLIIMNFNLLSLAFIHKTIKIFVVDCSWYAMFCIAGAVCICRFLSLL